MERAPRIPSFSKGTHLVATQQTFSSVVGRLRDQGFELVIVIGPVDKDDACLDWVGSVLSVTGRVPGVPTVEQAVRDGLFHPGCRHTVAVFDPTRLPVQRVEEAKACTRHARAAMEARLAGEEPPFLPLRKHLREEAARRTATVADVGPISPRAKFERVYEAARRAEAAGDKATALLKCRAALGILGDYDLFGGGQERLVEVLEDSVRRLQS